MKHEETGGRTSATTESGFDQAYELPFWRVSFANAQDQRFDQAIGPRCRNKAPRSPCDQHYADTHAAASVCNGGVQ